MPGVTPTQVEAAVAAYNAAITAGKSQNDAMIAALNAYTSIL